MTFDKSGQDTSLNVREGVQIPRRRMRCQRWCLLSSDSCFKFLCLKNVQNVAKISIPIVRVVCPVIGDVTVTLSVRSLHCRPEGFYTRAESAARRSYCTLVLKNSHCSLSRHFFSCIKPFRLSSRCPSSSPAAAES